MPTEAEIESIARGARLMFPRLSEDEARAIAHQQIEAFEQDRKYQELTARKTPFPETKIIHVSTPGLDSD